MRFVERFALAFLGPATKVVIYPPRVLARTALAAIRILLFGAHTILCSISARTLSIVLLRARPETRWRVGLAIINHWLRNSARIFGLRIKVRGLRPPPGSLIVSNHRSTLDIAALGAVTPCFFLAKAEVARWPFIGSGAAAAGLPFVRREAGESRKAALSAIEARLSAGFSLVNFPEGTTTARPEPLPFRPGLFRRVAGMDLTVVPTTLRFSDGGADWVGDTTFVAHLWRIAARPRTKVHVIFSEPLNAAEYADGDSLCESAYYRVCNPRPLPGRDVEGGVDYYLERPWLRTMRYRIHRGRYTITVHDQPGRWMTADALERLRAELASIARGSMDAVPTYGIFEGSRQAFANRVIAVMHDTCVGEPVAFTAMVYLPVESGGEVEPVMHLGLTMIRKEYRGQRLQTPLFKRIWWSPILNQRRLSWTITSIAASPAGIGAASDYFHETYPHYAGLVTRQPWHLEVARQVLQHQRHEFGCSERAWFDEQSFVVKGSNDPASGGAWQFIKEDPVSRYRVPDCNAFCRERLEFSRGDELFQVGRLALLSGHWESRAAKRQVATLSEAPTSTARPPEKTAETFRDAA